MISESVAGRSRSSAGAHAFWWRLTDNLFRRLPWFIVPVLATTLLGVAQARDTLELYGSSATLSASSNPLVPEQPISGVNAQFWETPAGVTSRIINERLRTDSFLEAVAEQAGLGGAIDSGLLSLNVVRASVWASANGNSILSVSAQWADPQTSYELVAATISQYETFLTETVASDSSEAEEFWGSQLVARQTERDEAEQALAEFVAQLPEPDERDSYPLNVELELERLSAKVDAAENRIAITEGNIDAARLARTQQTTEAGRSFTVIDQPKVPGAPNSTMMKQASLVASFFLLGLVIAAAALLVTTVLDQTVASSADLLAVAGISLVATVPPVALSNGDPKSRSFVSRRRRRAYSRGSRVG